MHAKLIWPQKQQSAVPSQRSDPGLTPELHHLQYIHAWWHHCAVSLTGNKCCWYAHRSIRNQLKDANLCQQSKQALDHLAKDVQQYQAYMVSATCSKKGEKKESKTSETTTIQTALHKNPIPAPGPPPQRVVPLRHTTNLGPR